MKQLLPLPIPTDLITSCDDLERVKLEFEYHRWSTGGKILPAYRGEGRSIYTLRPSFCREVVHQNPMQSEKEMQCGLFEILKIKKLERIILNDHLIQMYRQSWNLPLQLQHLRLPTRMLDWSLDIERALYFAVEDEKDWDSNGQLWCLFPNEPFTSRALNDDYFEIQSTHFVNVSGFLNNNMEFQVGEKNRFNQLGVFTIQPYELAYIPIEEQETPIGNLKKYEIPKDSKKHLKNTLEKKGVHEHTIYESKNPELDEIVSCVRKEYGYPPL